MNKLLLNRRFFPITIIITFSSLLLVSELLYHSWANMGMLSKPFETFVLFSFWAFILLKAKSKITVSIFSVIFILGEMTNRLHHALYKAWTNSYEYLLISDNIGEIFQTGKTLITPFLPHILWGAFNCLILISLLFLRKKTTNNKQVDFFALVVFVCLAIVFAKPGSTRGINIDDRHSQLKANIYSLMHFVVKVVPTAIFSIENVPLQTEKTFAPIDNIAPIDHIFFILGESQNSSHMSVFGYKNNPTTPFLSKKLNDANFVIKESFAVGIATSVSLPTLFNAIEKPNGSLIVSSGSQNLYHLAKQQQYYTAFFSTQSKSDISYINDIGARWIDEWKNPTDLGFNETLSISDNYLLTFLDTFLKSNSHKRSFITLHQRGSHSPYGLLLDDDEKIFGEETLSDRYDNTVYKTDQLIEKIIEAITKANLKNWIVIYISDHGQFIDGQSFGHIQFKDEIMSVPSVIYSPTDTIVNNYYPKLNSCPKLSASQIPLLILSLMGYGADYTNCSNVFINGPLLTGEGGYMEVTQDIKSGNVQMQLHQ